MLRVFFCGIRLSMFGRVGENDYFCTILDLYVMRDFVAIDFETANGNQCSICSVGIVIVKEDEPVDSFYSLVKPTPNYYSWFCRRVHGLGHGDTDKAESFPEVWAQVQAKIHIYFPYMEDTEVPFVAHNARFDEGCLRAAFEAYEIAYPRYEFLDTLLASRRHFGRSLPNHQLQTVAKACGFDLTSHHHALADAEACAWIARAIL